MRIITDTVNISELQELANERFGDLVKAVVDIERGIMAIGGEMHADEEALLLEHGSEQQNLWGINMYPDMPRADWVEFDSVINIRPRQGNRSRSVDDPQIRERIIKIVTQLTA